MNIAVVDCGENKGLLFVLIQFKIKKVRISVKQEEEKTAIY